MSPALCADRYWQEICPSSPGFDLSKNPFHCNKKQNTNNVSILLNKWMEGSLRVIKATEGLQTDSTMMCLLSPWVLTQYVCQGLLKLHGCAWTLKRSSPGRRVLCPLPANQPVKMLWCTNTHSELPQPAAKISVICNHGSFLLKRLWTKEWPKFTMDDNFGCGKVPPWRSAAYPLDVSAAVV